MSDNLKSIEVSQRPASTAYGTSFRVKKKQRYQEDPITCSSKVPQSFLKDGIFVPQQLGNSSLFSSQPNLNRTNQS